MEDKESDVLSGRRREMLMDVAVTAGLFNLNGSGINKFECDHIDFLVALKPADTTASANS